MDKNQNGTGKQPTGIFEMLSGTSTSIDTTTKITASTETAVTLADGNTHRTSTEKNLRKRLARVANSRPVLVLAVLLSCSAVLTAFRAYYLPVTVSLTAVRVLYAAAVWTVYLTAGRKGGGFLAALPLYATAAECALLVFFAVFLFCAMFGKMILIGGSGGVALVRLVYSASLWAIIPALLCIAVAYCLYLFKRHERLLFCNIRDGLVYGFAFENGYKSFTRCAIITAIALPVLHVIYGIIGPFGSLGFLPDGAGALFAKLMDMGGNYYLALVGLLTHSAVLITATTVAGKYAAVVKKHKSQKEMRRMGAKAQEETLL